MPNPNKTIQSLANLPEITELSRLALYSDFILADESRKETPISMVIVAPPEQGKTAVIKQFDPTDGLLYIDNVTAWGIEHKYIKELQSGKIRRVVIPDFIDPTNRKKTTVDSTITFFNKYVSWEGLKEIQTYAMDLSLDEPIKGSLLTTMATDDFKRMVRSLAAVGFLSRLLVVGYQYSKEELDVLLEDIVYGRAKWGQIKLSFPDTKVAVKLNPDLAIKMKPLAKQLGEKAGAKGIRAMLQLETLAKSVALEQGRDEVIDTDIGRVMYLAHRYINNVGLATDTKAFLKQQAGKYELDDTPTEATASAPNKPVASGAESEVAQ